MQTILKLIWKAFLYLSCFLLALFAIAILLWGLISLVSHVDKFNIIWFALTILWPLSGLIGLSSFVLYETKYVEPKRLVPFIFIGVLAALPFFVFGLASLWEEIKRGFYISDVPFYLVFNFLFFLLPVIFGVKAILVLIEIKNTKA